MFFAMQIFLLDNLDLGILNKHHNVLPRISDFDPESFRKMLIMAADPVKGATSYSHANVVQFLLDQHPFSDIFMSSDVMFKMLIGPHILLSNTAERCVDGLLHTAEVSLICSVVNN